jgi:hypothetical protein
MQMLKHKASSKEQGRVLDWLLYAAGFDGFLLLAGHAALSCKG